MCADHTDLASKGAAQLHTSRRVSPLVLQGSALIVLALLLVAVDAVCYRIALPVSITVEHGAGTLRVGSQVVALGQVAPPVAVVFEAHDPVVHEYQIDGTDSTNNFTLDATYLDGIAQSPYYRFQA